MYVYICVYIDRYADVAAAAAVAGAVAAAGAVASAGAGAAAAVAVAGAPATAGCTGPQCRSTSAPAYHAPTPSHHTPGGPP